MNEWSEGQKSEMVMWELHLRCLPAEEDGGDDDENEDRPAQPNYEVSKSFHGQSVVRASTIWRMPNSSLPVGCSWCGVSHPIHRPG